MSEWYERGYLDARNDERPLCYRARNGHIVMRISDAPDWFDEESYADGWQAGVTEADE